VFSPLGYNKKLLAGQQQCLYSMDACRLKLTESIHLSAPSFLHGLHRYGYGALGLKIRALKSGRGGGKLKKDYVNTSLEAKFMNIQFC
jgi:hypothetical protein